MGQNDDPHAEIGLGDLAWIDTDGEPDMSRAINHYKVAMESGIPFAALRLAWAVLAGGSESAEKIDNARKYFESGTELRDADAFAGLGWLKDRFGKTQVDLEIAFINYTVAQYLYENSDDIELARQVAGGRSSLAQLLTPKQVATRFFEVRRYMYLARINKQ
jgi:hypothetical protein